MIIKKVELVAVSGNNNQYPDENKKEVAFVGRSNVGKSSLINIMLNRRIAKVSSSPGKTRTINFYEINDKFRIVDLPGYGYANVSKSVMRSWGEMIDTYLKNRPNLVKVIQLVDIRHSPTDQDKQMYEWMKHYGLDGFVIATKADKISRNELSKNLSIIRKKLEMSESDKVLPVSALKKTGTDDLMAEIKRLLEE